MTGPKYPNFSVDLSGIDGDQNKLIAAVTAQLRNGNVPTEEISQWESNARSGDFSHTLSLARQMVNVTGS